MVGLPQPRLTDSVKPISFSSSAEYEPLQPQSGPSAWQQPAGPDPRELKTASCFAALAYRDLTASLTSLMTRLLPSMDVDGWMLAQSIEECEWVVVEYGYGLKGTTRGQGARRVL